jgi:hypothetical protein
LPISAVDAITPAFQHTKQQLVEPFGAGQWARLALVGFLAGELSSGGGCNSFQMPQRTSGSQRFLDTGFGTGNPAFSHPALYGGLILLLIVLGLVLFVVFVYVSSVMRFVLFDSVITKHCRIRQKWSRWQGQGWRYFLWQIVLFLFTMMGFIILVGIPAAIALAAGWFNQPKQHLVPLILGGMVLFFFLLAFVVLLMVIHVLTKDFVVPQMALENISALEAWRRLLPMLKAEKGGYAGYMGMKIVMALGAAVVVGVVAAVLILVILIPIGGMSAVVILLGKAGGLEWNAYTITLAVVVGSIVLMFILYLVSVVSVPAIVFFPAYSIYFFAARYPALEAMLHPASTAPPEPPPMPPPLVEPIS